MYHGNAFFVKSGADYYRNFIYHCPDTVEYYSNVTSVSKLGVWINDAIEQGIQLAIAIAKDVERLNLATC